MLGALGALPLALAACAREKRAVMTEKDEAKRSGTGRMPVVFAAHGAPVLLDDAGWMSELASWARAMPRPKSILMVSAHWEHRPATLGAT